jgi:PAS domain S-box-containing protein
MRILHLEDNAGDAASTRRHLLAAWPEAEIFACADTSKVGLILLRSANFDVVLSDLRIGGASGMAVLELVRQMSPDTPVIFLAASVDEESALNAFLAGAADCLFKDRIQLLVPAIRRAIAHREERARARQLERQCGSQTEMLERALDVIIVEEPDGRISFWNRAAEQLLGWQAREAIGRRLKSFAGADVASALSAAARATSEKGEWRGEMALTSKDGKAVTFDFRRTLVRDRDGRPLAQLSIGNDLTGTRQLEEQLYRAQRMESISLLAAGIAHDLNNVLTPIIMALGLLKHDLREPSQVRIMSTLEKSADRGASLVRQLLSFMQGTPSAAQAFDVNNAIREIGSVIRDTFPPSIELCGNSADGLWMVKAQGTHLHQVLLNLAVNARDAMPEGGKLEISARNVSLTEEQARLLRSGRSGDFVVVTVADTGTGIRPEDRDRIWEPFFTTKPEGMGTGLGLPTVRGIVTRYKGFVDLDSAVGSGTCFRVYFPAVTGSVPDEGPPVAPASERGNGENVLVIDGSREVLDLTATVLSRYGYRTATVADGLGGAALFQKDTSQFSVVVSDLQAPGLSGRRLGLALRKLNPDVRLVFTGSDASQEESSDMRELGAQFLAKPFQPAELLCAVISALKQGEHVETV